MRAPSLVGVVALALAGCAGPTQGGPGDVPPRPPEAASATSGVQTEAPGAVADGTDRLLTVDTGEGEEVTTLTSALPVVADVVNRDGGKVLADTDLVGRPVLTFPAYSTDEEPARAIVRVVPSVDGTADPLSPGLADFVFGADFSVDAQSQGTDVDSGNNLLQRGLASDPSQYKMEVDGDRPACRIHGPEGTAEVRATQRVRPERWYRLRCSRTGTTVQLTVLSLYRGQTTVVEEVQTESPTGDLQWSPGTPLSVGGKLAANGGMIRTATDQFNGSIADPVLRVEG